MIILVNAKLGSQTKKAEYRFINDALVYAYDGIMRIEEREIKKSKFKDITVKELNLVHTIGLHDRKTTSQVAHLLKLSKGTLTANLNTLEKKGYIVRIANQQDHRVINLGLTNKGRLLYRAHEAFHRKMVKAFLSGFDDSNVDLIKEALINLEKFIDKVDSET